MKRIASAPLVLACGAALGACDLDLGTNAFDGFCLDGPCGTGGGGGVAVGDTFTLHLVVGPRGGPSAARDTIHPVRWEVADSAVAGISSAASGAGSFRAKAPGATHVIANSQPHTLWACRAQACSRVGKIVVAR